MTSIKTHRVTAEYSAIEGDWNGYQSGTLFHWVIEIGTGPTASFEVLAPRDGVDFLPCIDDLIAAAGHRREGNWAATADCAFAATTAVSPTSAPVWATNRGKVSTDFLGSDSIPAGVTLMHSRELFTAGIPTVEGNVTPLTISLRRDDAYHNGSVAVGEPWVALGQDTDFDLLPVAAHELAVLLAKASAILDDEAESVAPHRIVTVERAGGFAARCECDCNATTFGGFQSRAKAREALAFSWGQGC